MPSGESVNNGLPGFQRLQSVSPTKATPTTQTKDDPDDRPRLAIKVNKCKYDKAEKNQQKASWKQPDDGRG